MKKLNLSDKQSLKVRKYIIGPFLFLLALIILFSNVGTWLKLLSLLLLGLGVFYMILRKVEFDEEFVYVAKKKYRFKDIKRISTIEVNLMAFVVIVIQENGRTRKIFTDTGQHGVLRLILASIFPSLDPFKNVKKFKELLDASKTT